MRTFIYSLCLIIGVLSVNACEDNRLDNSLYDHILPYGSKDDNSKANGDFRMLCYNIRHCEGTDGVVDIDRIATIIKALNADIVCIQEVDSVTNRSKVNQAQVLGEKTGMKGYFKAAIPFQNGKYGVGILSKETPAKTYGYSLPGAEQRTVLIAEYADFIIMSTHLDLEENNRLESVKILTEKALAIGKKAYLMGDFNESDRSGKVFKELDKNWTVVSSTKNTFSTSNPSKCIDFILTLNKANTDYKVSKTSVVYTLPEVNVSVASDHYPVYCDFSK